MGNSIATVFFQKACIEKNLTGSIKIIVKKVHTRLVSIGMFICLILMIIGPELFSFFLGAQWSDDRGLCPDTCSLGFRFIYFNTVIFHFCGSGKAGGQSVV